MNRRHTDPFTVEALAVPGWYERRVLPKIVKAEGCRIWTGARATGYGMISLPTAVTPVGSQINVCVHRVVWMKERGPIEVGLVLDHDGPTGCHNRACCDPDHLQPVTQRHNIMVTGHGVVSDNGRKTHCPKGHPLEGDNLRPLQSGWRDCLTCYRSRGAVLARAAKALGLTYVGYGTAFGYSQATALHVIAESLAVAS
jgi:hypothetical protein